MKIKGRCIACRVWKGTSKVNGFIDVDENIIPLMKKDYTNHQIALSCGAVSDNKWEKTLNRIRNENDIDNI